MTPNVLLYERPYTKVFFRKVVNGVFENCNLITLSEYKNCSDIWQSSFLYDKSLDDFAELCDESTTRDIVNRCRTLRIMDYSRAKRIVQRTWAGVANLFEKQKIDYVISLSLDNYVIDIIFRLAAIFDVPVYSFLGSFAEGYVRFTLRGEHNFLHRGVSKEESEQLLSKLMKSYYLPPSETESSRRSLWSVRKWYLRRKTIEDIYYPLMKLITRDPDNARYNMLNLKGIRFNDCVSSELKSIFTKVDEIAIDRKKAVYFPLHFCPEATTDYYIDRPTECGGYIEYILDVISNSDPDILFLIKEHPSMYGERLISDYKRILEFPNAVLIHPQERSNKILELIDTVVVDNGTVGVESLLRGKKVLALDRSYYSGLHNNLYQINYVKKDMMGLPQWEYDPIPFISKLLDGWIEGDYKHSNDQSHYDPQPVAQAIRRMINEGIRLG